MGDLSESVDLPDLPTHGDVRRDLITGRLVKLLEFRLLPEQTEQERQWSEAGFFALKWRVLDVLTGQEYWIPSSYLSGERLNEMEILAWISRAEANASE